MCKILLQSFRNNVNSLYSLLRNNAYCACFDNLHGTVRRRSTKCKHCQKVGSSKNNSHTTKNNNSAESTLKKLTKTVHAVQGGQGKMVFLLYESFCFLSKMYLVLFWDFFCISTFILSAVTSLRNILNP